MAKPPFPWIGSKEKIAPYILQLFPPKLTQYVEPFGGSGAVLLALPPDPNRLDIYNDLDAELVNLYSCIKECSNVLLRELRFLPIHSRKLFEYYLCRSALCQNGAALPDRRKAGAFPQIPCPALAGADWL